MKNSALCTLYSALSIGGGILLTLNYLFVLFLIAIYIFDAFGLTLDYIYFFMNKTINSIILNIASGKSEKKIWLKRLKEKKQHLLADISKMQNEIENVNNLINKISELPEINKSQ